MASVLLRDGLPEATRLLHPPLASTPAGVSWCVPAQAAASALQSALPTAGAPLRTVAEALDPESHRDVVVLDVGCGNDAAALARTVVLRHEASLFFSCESSESLLRVVAVEAWRFPVADGGALKPPSAAPSGGAIVTRVVGVVPPRARFEGTLRELQHRVVSQGDAPAPREAAVAALLREVLSALEALHGVALEGVAEGSFVGDACEPPSGEAVRPVVVHGGVGADCVLLFSPSASTAAATPSATTAAPSGSGTRILLAPSVLPSTARQLPSNMPLLQARRIAAADSWGVGVLAVRLLAQAGVPLPPASALECHDAALEAVSADFYRKFAALSPEQRGSADYVLAVTQQYAELTGLVLAELPRVGLRLPPGLYSRECEDFVDECLAADPRKRALPRALLRHRFIRAHLSQPPFVLANSTTAAATFAAAGDLSEATSNRPHTRQALPWSSSFAALTHGDLGSALSTAAAPPCVATRGLSPLECGDSPRSTELTPRRLYAWETAGDSPRASDWPQASATQQDPTPGSTLATAGALYVAGAAAASSGSLSPLRRPSLRQHFFQASPIASGYSPSSSQVYTQLPHHSPLTASAALGGGSREWGEVARASPSAGSSPSAPSPSLRTPRNALAPIVPQFYSSAAAAAVAAAEAASAVAAAAVAAAAMAETATALAATALREERGGVDFKYWRGAIQQSPVRLPHESSAWKPRSPAGDGVQASFVKPLAPEWGAGAEAAHARVHARSHVSPLFAPTPVPTGLEEREAPGAVSRDTPSPSHMSLPPATVRQRAPADSRGGEARAGEARGAQPQPQPPVLWDSGAAALRGGSVAHGAVGDCAGGRPATASLRHSPVYAEGSGAAPARQPPPPAPDSSPAAPPGVQRPQRLDIPQRVEPPTLLAMRLAHVANLAAAHAVAPSSAPRAPRPAHTPRASPGGHSVGALFHPSPSPTNWEATSASPAASIGSGSGTPREGRAPRSGDRRSSLSGGGRRDSAQRLAAEGMPLTATASSNSGLEAWLQQQHDSDAAHSGGGALRGFVPEDDHPPPTNSGGAIGMGATPYSLLLFLNSVNGADAAAKAAAAAANADGGAGGATGHSRHASRKGAARDV